MAAFSTKTSVSSVQIWGERLLILAKNEQEIKAEILSRAVIKLKPKQ